MQFLALLLSLAVLTGAQAESTNEVVVLRRFVDNEISAGNFFLKSVDLPIASELEEGQVLLKLVGVSADPYMSARLQKDVPFEINWSTGTEDFMVGPIKIGMPISSGGVAKVIASKAPGYQVDSYVGGFFPWQNYIRTNPSAVRLSNVNKSSNIDSLYELLFDINITPLSAWMPIRAFWPMQSVPEPCVAYVSGAAGGVGMIAAQILKNVYGCLVIVSAGSDVKLEYLLSIGYDSAFKYKVEPPSIALPRLAPNKLNLFFDNVGGDTFDAGLAAMESNGRIITCGGMSEAYHRIDHNLTASVDKNITIQQFFVLQFRDTFEVGQQELTSWINDGKLKMKLAFYDGLEKAPEAFVGLFHGSNIGKTIVRVSEYEGKVVNDEL